MEIEKSAVSEYFIEASRGRLQKLQSRPLVNMRSAQ